MLKVLKYFQQQLIVATLEGMPLIMSRLLWHYNTHHSVMDEWETLSFIQKFDWKKIKIQIKAKKLKILIGTKPPTIRIRLISWQTNCYLKTLSMKILYQSYRLIALLIKYLKNRTLEIDTLIYPVSMVVIQSAMKCDTSWTLRNRCWGMEWMLFVNYRYNLWLTSLPVIMLLHRNI